MPAISSVLNANIRGQLTLRCTMEQGTDADYKVESAMDGVPSRHRLGLVSTKDFTDNGSEQTNADADAENEEIMDFKSDANDSADVDGYFRNRSKPIEYAKQRGCLGIDRETIFG
jgi:hypothetical protein